MRKLKYTLAVATAIFLTTTAANAAENSSTASVSSASQSLHVTDRASFDEYIRRFNNKDFSAFEAFYADNIRMQNGNLVLNGVDEVKAHYTKIWSVMREDLHVQNFVMAGDTVAIELKAHFTAEKDAATSPFGPLTKGENYDFYGVIMYRLNDQGKFYDIRIGYISFTNTKDGKTTSLGLPH